MRDMGKMNTFIATFITSTRASRSYYVGKGICRNKTTGSRSSTIFHILESLLTDLQPDPPRTPSQTPFRPGHLRTALDYHRFLCMHPPN